MIDFKVGPDGDVVFENGDIVLVEGDEELCQCIVDILLTNLGEWYLNPEHGFARFNVLGQKFDRQRVTDELIAAILQEPRVASVESVQWEFDREKRKLSGTFRIVKQSGETVEGSF